MKEKKECPDVHPKPNMKNKKFVAWSRAESCKREDNIVSSEWREKLQKTNPFKPVYDNAPVNMVYIMSGEYGRIWQKERDEWYGSVFVLNSKEKNMEDRKKKIRKEMKLAKKAAEENIKIRKERRAEENAIKAKEEAEKMEKLKARITRLKSANQKMPRKSQENRKISTKSEPSKKGRESMKSEKLTPAALHQEEPKQEVCPKGYMQTEVTLQCDCSIRKEDQKEAEPIISDSNKAELAKAEQTEIKEEKPEESCQAEVIPVCNHYLEQMKEIQKAKAEGTEEQIKKEPEEVKECCKPLPSVKQEKVY